MSFEGAGEGGCKMKTVGFTCGSFDLFHAGHVMMLKECKDRFCDYLIVGLQSDPTIDRSLIKNKPIQSMEERYLLLSACKYVDEIRCYDTEADLFKLLEALRPEVRILGEDWRGKKFTGNGIPGIRNVFNSRSHNLSTSELRRRVWDAEAKRIMDAATNVDVVTSTGPVVSLKFPDFRQEPY